MMNLWYCCSIVHTTTSYNNTTIIRIILSTTTTENNNTTTCNMEQTAIIQPCASAHLVGVLAISLILTLSCILTQRDTRIRKHRIVIKRNYHGGEKKDIHGRSKEAFDTRRLLGCT